MTSLILEYWNDRKWRSPRKTTITQILTLHKHDRVLWAPYQPQDLQNFVTSITFITSTILNEWGQLNYEINDFLFWMLMEQHLTAFDLPWAAHHDLTHRQVFGWHCAFSGSTVHPSPTTHTTWGGPDPECNQIRASLVIRAFLIPGQWSPQLYW